MSQMDKFSCLIVDDDAGFVAMLAKVIHAEGGEVSECANLKLAREAIERRWFDLVLLDNRLPDGTGFEFFPELHRSCPDGVVVMVTGVPELGKAIELTRNGLFDYLTKPLNVADLIACLKRVRQRLSHPDQAEADDELLGHAPAMREALNLLRQAARYPQTTVLLFGETGTGKDLAARMLHRLTQAGQSTSAAYIALNCSAVPAEMFESELFGSERGAFTGADRRRTGLIEAASGGTLFLDEITEIPLSQQAKLLRFLESREYRSLGSNLLHTFSGRIITATNRSLEEEIKRGRFREDLMFRLTVAVVRLPALREHISDLELLVENLLTQLCTKYRRKKPFLKPSDLEALHRHDFPGNVRELRNLLERALLRTAEESAWLAFDLAWLSHSLSATGPAGLGGTFPVLPAERQLNPIDLQEYTLIQQALQAEGGGIRRAASRLGITHQALLRRLEKWPELRLVARA
jgi:DNA-binding NtrC family response regulator